MLLTGGRSRRMGRDKAAIPLAHGGASSTLARRTADLLRSIAEPVLEVGPGYSGLPAVREDPPGSGPLAATAAGWSALAELGWKDPVLVVATDLPLLTSGLLRWLADRAGDLSLVPVAADRVQPLCARYRWSDLAEAAKLVEAGRRSMADLLSVIDAVLIPEEEWVGPAGDARVLQDADTPADLRRLLDRT